MTAWDLFKGWRFDREIIVLCVRWYMANAIIQEVIVHRGKSDSVLMRGR